MCQSSWWLAGALMEERLHARAEEFDVDESSAVSNFAGGSVYLGHDHSRHRVSSNKPSAPWLVMEIVTRSAAAGRVRRMMEAEANSGDSLNYCSQYR